MNKKTQMWIGVAAVAGLAIWIYNKNKKPKDVFTNFKGQPRTMPDQVGDCPTGYFLNGGVCLKKYCVGPGMTDLCTCSDRSCDKCICPGGSADAGGVHIVRNTL